MKPSRTILCFCLAIFSLAEPAGAMGGTRFDCPSSISTTQVAVNTPKGWSLVIGSRAHSASALALENVRFYVGSKTSHDIELASKNDVLSTVEIWEFGKRKNQELIYQSCEYQNTVLKIERALPAEITACSVTHPSVTDQSRENNPEPLIKSIDCK